MARKNPPSTDLVLVDGGVEGEAKAGPKAPRRGRNRRKGMGTEPVITTEGLPARPPGPVLCAECRGPLFLCQGCHDPAEGVLGAEELRVVTGLRAAYLGLLLGPVAAPAERIGGILLLAARAHLLGADRRVANIAALIADPRSPAVGPVEAAALMCEVLAPETPDKPRASHLYTLLRKSTAPYLHDAARMAITAAMACPVKDHRAYDLVAILCTACTRSTCPDPKDPKGDWDRLAGVEVYDHAVRCPVCKVEHAHPLGFKRQLHAVSRCYGDEKTGCRTHRNLPLTLGICPEGRTVYENAYAGVGAEGDKEREPWERRLLEALLRAKKREEFDALNAELHKREPIMDQLGRMFAGAIGLEMPGAGAAKPKILPKTARRPDETEE